MGLWSWKWYINVTCWLREILPQKVNILQQWFHGEIKDFFLAAFTTIFLLCLTKGFDSSRSSVTRRCVRIRRVLLMTTCCIPSGSYGDPSSRKKGQSVWIGLNLELKTSPTKVRLVSLKRILKQAGRSHERRDVDFAERADFAAFDLRNQTQLNCHSNTYKRGFPLDCSMPNFNDVRLRETQKWCQKSKKDRHHIVQRGQGVQGAKLQCHHNECCVAEFFQPASYKRVYMWFLIIRGSRDVWIWWCQPTFPFIC